MESLGPGTNYSRCYYASIGPPDGATITQLIAVVDDTSTTFGTDVDLDRCQANRSVDYNTLATASTSATAAPYLVTTSAAPTSFPLVDRQNHGYVLEFCGAPGTPSSTPPPTTFHDGRSDHRPHALPIPSVFMLSIGFAI
ncbi:MAG: hypothetical protein JWM34_2223 [Ilumatobacteraceae bacterium]|nr:hypothetical protein [Ilumatobacteraceae bacterium]